jgi:uncharacterized protein (DUF1810 family)
MTREQEYWQSADNAFGHAAEEESAHLMAQWKILGARYLELTNQSNQIANKETISNLVEIRLVLDR